MPVRQTPKTSKMKPTVRIQKAFTTRNAGIAMPTLAKTTTTIAMIAKIVAT